MVVVHPVGGETVKRAGLIFFVLLCVVLYGINTARAQAEDAHSTGCLPQATAAQQVCAACHKQDATARLQTGATKPCTPYCMSCHQPAEMERHHTVDAELPAQPADAALHLAEGKRMGCVTCHDLSRPRYDSVRWKAASLFDRLFRDSPQYKTYFLSMRNDTGQLCLVCH